MGIKQTTVGVMVNAKITGTKDVVDGTEKIKSSVKSVKKEAEEISFGKIQGQLKQALSGDVDAAQALAGSLNSVGVVGAAAGAAVGLAFAAVAKYVADVTLATQQSALELAAFRQKIGNAGSYEFLGAIRQSAEKLDVSLNAVESGLNFFVQKLQATEGTTAGFEAALNKVADRFQTMPDGAEKSKLAIEAFGRAGESLVPILNQGSEGVQKLMQHMRDTGQAIDESMVATAQRAQAAQQQLNDTVDGFNTRVGSQTLPVLADAFAGLNKMIDAATSGERPLRNLNDAALSLGMGIAEVKAEAATSAGPLLSMGAAAVTAAGQLASAVAMLGGAKQIIVGVSTIYGKIAQQQFDAARASVQYEVGLRGQISTMGVWKAAATGNELAMRKIAQGTQVATGRLDDYNEEQDQYAQIALESQRITIAQADAMRAVGHAAGGAAKEIDALAEAQDELKKRTDAINGGIGISTDAMSKVEQLQTAWKLATGQTTLEQLRQDAAMKSLMKSYDAGAITMSDALATLVAFRNGQIDINRVFDVAGDAAKPFKDELNKLYTDMGDGLAKVADLASGLDKLPGAKKVELSAGVSPGSIKALDDLHERMAAIQDREVTIKINVAGLEQLGGLFPGVGRTGSQPIGSGSEVPDPPSGTAPSAPPGEGKGGVTNITLKMDSKAVGKAVIDNAAGAAKQNRKRSYRG